MRSQQFSCSGKAASFLGKAIRRWGGVWASALLLCAFAAPGQAANAGFGPLVKMSQARTVPLALRQATPLGRMDATASVQAMISLPWRNAGDLQTLIARQADPADTLYKKFLTAPEFNARFAPTQADYDAVKSWAKSSGLSVDKTTPSRNLVFVRGARDTVESAFHVQLNRFQLQTGRVVYVNNASPSVPQSIAAKISGVTGLDNYALMRPQLQRPPALSSLAATGMQFGAFAPLFTGTAPNGALSPADIRSLYNINPLISTEGLDGSGQTVALYELGGYTTSDITAYATTFSLVGSGTDAKGVADGSPNLENVLIDKFSGDPTDPNVAGEVTLDIEMILAVAPKAKVIIYEADQTDFRSTPVNVNFDVLNTIANENRGSVVSISYGQSEEDSDFSGKRALEANIFSRMVAQGQCVYVSSGDNAAYLKVFHTRDPNATPGGYAQAVSDPSSQPLVVSVGGTTLLGAGPGYAGETTWFNAGLNTGAPEGGGGGSSKYWTKPGYQTGVGASATMRDLPDVSLNADPATGYAVYFEGGFQQIGGTSASAPLWAAFNLLVNQQRAFFGLGRQGFANPDIYKAAESANYASYFHDIADGSSNGIPAFAAVTGFDDSTGWGTYNAANLIGAFAPIGSNVQPLTVQVHDLSTGGPAVGVLVTVKASLIPGFQPAAFSTDATGTVALNLDATLNNYFGQSVPLTFTVSVDAPNKTGSVVSGVTLPRTTTNPVVLTVRNTDHTYASSANLQMISAPFDYSTVADFATLFGLSSPIATSTVTGRPLGALFAFSPTANSYLRYPSAPADTLRLGVGYWALLPSASPYIHRNGLPAPTNQPYRIALQPGWNMIGDPFGAAVSITAIQVEGVATLPAPTAPSAPLGSSSLVQMPLYTWDGTKYVALGAGDAIQPFVGYWIFANQNATLVVPVP
ncbi:MAG: S53 family peptidase [Armatimonadota bacterium]|nr:S53 family peptidase [Armatimonadota bacterium]